MLIHGLHHHPLYSRWKRMKQRCLNPNSSDYKHYGARGIKICDLWISQPEEFINWCLNNGWKKELLIDRINNDGNYSPENCRFISVRRSNGNRRRKYKLPTGVRKTSDNKKYQAIIKFNGKTICLGTYNTIEEAVSIYQESLRKVENGEIVNTIKTGRKIKRKYNLPEGVKQSSKNTFQARYRNKYIGNFPSVYEAHRAYLKAKEQNEALRHQG